MIRDSMAVHSIRQSDLTAFFAYLNDRLRDNGVNGTHFFNPCGVPNRAFRGKSERTSRVDLLRS
ncbi:hypothetical protein [Massilia psychrophila]|uniref:hypothetical protein n=1 Tax=Massilia psychrophila TaxID=1603353 RepID=UPI00118112A5|nr:hypothetical protein [Massilia psychrophila]GGE66250.1 hypothetical protein GCM10008020_08270 [Massilia psychrophila]